VYAETGTTPNCSDENSFTVTVNLLPILITATINSPECGQETGSISVDSPQVGFEYTLINEANPIDTQTLIAAGVPAIAVFNNVGAGTYTVTAASPDGCMAELTGQIVNQAPVLIISCPPSITLECGDSIDPSNTGSVLVNSDCSNATITYIDNDLIGGCNAITGSFTRSFTVIDEFGNTERCEQTITIEDTSSPQFVDEILTNVFTTCEAIPEAITPIVVDDCDNNVSVLFTETSTANECEYQYTIERTWTATDTCGNETSFNQIIHVSCPVIVYNGLSINNDGNNDNFYIKGIECFPENNVKIFNRWGVLVFERDNYNNSNNTFKGISEGRITIAKNKKLPTGVYFYIINYKFIASDTPEIINQSGYLYIKND
jgi:gliding motility-associated-like protein